MDSPFPRCPLVRATTLSYKVDFCPIESFVFTGLLDSDTDLQGDPLRKLKVFRIIWSKNGEKNKVARNGKKIDRIGWGGPKFLY